jgi:SAM-dependent methyltransferase
VLEVGNVLGHYGTERRRDVIDKYERFPGVLNTDVLDFRPEHLYDLIVSVSTLEHVGWDEEPRDPERAAGAVERLRELLAPGGLLVVTVPVGYHPQLDLAIREGRARFDEVAALRHEGSGRWREVAPNDVWDLAYDRLLYEAGGLLVCTARAPD